MVWMSASGIGPSRRHAWAAIVAMPPNRKRTISPRRSASRGGRAAAAMRRQGPARPCRPGQEPMSIDLTVIVAAAAGVLLCIGVIWLRSRSSSGRELMEAKARYTAALAEAESVRRQAELDAQEELFRARSVEAEGRA